MQARLLSSSVETPQQLQSVFESLIAKKQSLCEALQAWNNRCDSAIRCFILLQNVLCQGVFDSNVLVSCGCCLLFSSCRRFYFYCSYHPPLLSSFKVQFAKKKKKKKMRIAFVAVSNTVCVLTESNLSVIVNHGVIIGC